MNINFAASEVAPYSKTGGLADLVGSLASEVAQLGHEVSVFSPYHRVVRKMEPRPKPVAEGAVPVGSEMIPWTLLEAAAPQGKAKVYFVASDTYFDREGIYGTPRGDYEDSCARFVFFSRACLEGAKALGRPVDVWHCHDWQAAMVAVYSRLLYGADPLLGGAASVFTIHNLAYQGVFWHWDWPILNLPWQHFHWREMEYHGKMNLLKGALVHSDLLATTSPTYAKEIQTQEFGCGLEGILSNRSADLVGIVNGIDTTEWNPARDMLIPSRYTATNPAGKGICRQALRKRLGLADDGSVIVGMIGRLFEQKGWDLVAQSTDELLRRNIQLVVLGTGREEYHRLLQQLQQSRPDRVSVSFAFDNSLAHLIEAGSDIFLMPSRYEPCGLNQLYSLAYGTPVVARRTGGLADTIVDATPETIAAGTATGFLFDEYGPKAMLAALDRALTTIAKPDVWRAIQRAGMSQDWSWRENAQKYIAAYTRATEAAQRRRDAAKK